MASSLSDALGSADVEDRLDPALLLPQGQSFTHIGVLDTVSGNFYWATIAQVKATLLANTQPNQLPLVQLAISANGITLGSSTTLTATATDPDGTISSVTFFDGTTALVALTTAPYTYVYTPGNVGSRNIRVVAIDNDGGSAQDSLPLVVVAGAPVVTPTPQISFGAIPTKQVGAAPFTLSATSTNAGVAITYASSNTSVATVSGNTVTVVGAGTATITASQAAGSGYNAATSVTQMLTVSAVATAPSAPIIGTTTPGDGQLTVNWQAPTSNGGAAITNYKVYRTGTTNAIATVGNVLSYVDATTPNGTPQTYQVSAVNSVGESAKSLVSTADTPQPTSGWLVLNSSNQEGGGVVFVPASTQRLRFAALNSTAGNTLSLQITDRSDNSVSYVSIPDDYYQQPFAFDRADGTTYTGTFPNSDLNFTA